MMLSLVEELKDLKADFEKQRNAAKYRGVPFSTDGIILEQVPRAPSIVLWHAPSPSWFKLNTDGSSLGNPGLAGAEGIIRDSAGHVHLAYQFALGIRTSVMAELTAVWRGMELALTHGLAPWWREANGAADHLAKEAASLQLTRVLHHDDITGILRGILCLDRQGISHIREGDDGFKTWLSSFFEEILWLALV
ncbi:UNVERIFIED_CONTAM: putative ribonuclease H protein [Sesamum radiatum]|uniref:Ribonuclease H protein n=1 Tax=Sesamum radiatum TaxID=300843 RepID=A0AAW2SK51_SESRA